MAILGEASDKALWVGPTDEIIRLHQDILGHARQSLNNAIRIGEILSQVKGAVKHGEWLPWIKEFAPFSIKTAENYMSCFKNKDKIASLTNLNEAYVLLLPKETNGAGQQLHEPNFHSRWVHITSQGQGEFAHWIQRRPLTRWATEELFDFLANVEPFIAIRDTVKKELESRPDAPSGYRP